MLVFSLFLLDILSWVVSQIFLPFLFLKLWVLSCFLLIISLITCLVLLCHIVFVSHDSTFLISFFFFGVILFLMSVMLIVWRILKLHFLTLIWLQEEGWPLGLQPLNVRVGLASRNPDYSGGSVSFNTILTGSPTSSTDSSSDLDTEVSDSVEKLQKFWSFFFLLRSLHFHWSCLGSCLRFSPLFFSFFFSIVFFNAQNMFGIVLFVEKIPLHQIELNLTRKRSIVSRGAPDWPYVDKSLPLRRTSHWLYFPFSSVVNGLTNIE